MCSTEDGWGNLGEHWFLWKRTSKKTLKCYECQQPIPAGEEHYLTYVKPSADWARASYRTHAACEALRDFVQKVVCGGHGYVLMGGLDDEISEAGDYLDQDIEAWEAAGKDPPNPLEEVWGEIIEHYKALAA
jgi:hypothetical protein